MMSVYYFYALFKDEPIKRETDVWGIFAEDEEEAIQRMKNQIFGLTADLYTYVPTSKPKDGHFLRGVLL